MNVKRFTLNCQLQSASVCDLTLIALFDKQNDENIIFQVNV